MGNYLHSWTPGPTYPESRSKYVYTSLESLYRGPEGDDDDELQVGYEHALPDLPVEVWSNIIVQLSFTDKVRATRHNLSRASPIFR